MMYYAPPHSLAPRRDRARVRNEQSGDTHYFSSSINTDGDSEQDESSSREAQDHQEPVGTAHGALEHMRGLNFDFCGESLVKVWPMCGDEYFVLVMFY